MKSIIPFIVNYSPIKKLAIIPFEDVKVNIKLIKKFKIKLIKKFNVVFPENVIKQLHFLEIIFCYFLFSNSSNLSFKR